MLTVTLGEAAHEDGLEFNVYYDYSGGSASEDDLGAAPATLSVPAGASTVTLSIPIAGDNYDDPGETFVVSITPGANDTDWTVAPGGTASATVTISGQAGPALSLGSDQPSSPLTFGDAAIPDKAYTVGAEVPKGGLTLDEVVDSKLPAATGGSGDITYTATGLPAGLNLGQDRVIRGTPTEATTGPVTVTYTAADGEGESATTVSLTFQVTVNPAVLLVEEDLLPYFRKDLQFFTNDTIEYTVGQATPLNLQFPEASGGTGTLTYYLGNRDPRTPMSEYARGLTFDPATRTLSSGTGMNEPAAGQSYALEYRAEDENGSWDSAYGSIEVNGPPSLPEIADQSFTAGDAVSLTLPAATGGSASMVNLRYSLEPQVPGLSFNTGPRTLSGTPTGTGATTVTYTVTDRNGVSDTRTFTITVAAGSSVPTSAPGSLETAQQTGHKRFAVSWAEVTGATGYAVQVAAEGASFPTDDGVSAWPEGYYVVVRGHIAVATVPEYGNYQVRVAAVNADGAGPWATVTATVAALPRRSRWSEHIPSPPRPCSARVLRYSNT